MRQPRIHRRPSRPALATAVAAGRIVSRGHYLGHPSQMSQSSQTTYDYDVFGRPTGYRLLPEGGRVALVATDPEIAVSYSYDALGRFASVTFGTNVFEYSRLPGTDLVSGYASGSFSRSVSYEPHRDLISAVTNSFNDSTPSTISTFEYANDAAGRRVSRLDTFDGEVTTNLFGYNARSEVTSALMGTNTYGYAYDPIGNRLTSSHNAETNSYTANALNQYTQITNLCASVPSAGEITPTYDADGNMTSDGSGWHYFWNGENRMICASNAEVVVTYAYDHRGRMVRKEIKHRDSETQSIHYTWDNWNIIRETLVTRHSSLVTDNVWGLDIDGTLQGAGGVGGLIAMIRDDGVFLPAYDANGNITEYMTGNGEVAAHYGYSPFGTHFAVSGSMLWEFTHQFSTKPYCEVTGLSEYQMRKYNPQIGRWMNRDPIGEKGSVCLMSFIGNKPLSHVDYIGEVPQIIGGALVGCAVGATYSLLSRWLARDSFCQCSCNAMGGCAVGALAGAVGVAAPQFSGCLAGLAGSVLNTGVGSACNLLCGRGDSEVKPTCVAATLIIDTVVGCLLSHGGTPLDKIQSSLLEFVSNIVGFDIAAYCGLFAD